MKKKNNNISFSTSNIIKILFIVLGFFAVIVSLVVLWYTGVIPVCGDNHCVPKECAQGCCDCNPNLCQDSICQPNVQENCQNSPDCKCDIHEVCAIGREGADSAGCYEIKCSDGWCDNKKEDTSNCCLDCGCPAGYTCNKEKNECQFSMPDLKIDYHSTAFQVSASTLYSNRKLVDDEGEEHPFLMLRIKNNGVNIAKNVKITVDMGEYTQEESKNIGSIEPSGTVKYEWYPTATESMLNIKDDQSLLITVKITYQDEYGKEYSFDESYGVEILGRNTWGRYSAHSQYVTPLDNTVRQAVSSAGSFSTQTSDGIKQAAETIWDFLGGLQIDYISDPAREYRQYPAEVLKTKRGDCDDLATLYVSLLESVGISTSLITIPGHMFAAFYAGGYIWPVETTLIGSSFQSALNAGIENYNEEDKQIIKIQDEWKLRNIKTPAYVGIEASQLEFPNIKVQLEQDADMECIEEGFMGIGCALYRLTIECNLDFINTGISKGQKCVNVLIYLDGDVVKSEDVCETVGAESTEHKKVKYTKDTTSSSSFTYLCRVN